MMFDATRVVLTFVLNLDIALHLLESHGSTAALPAAILHLDESLKR